jgi:hypothetical protein
MTEETLDLLRPLAVRIADESSRLLRALKGSSANEGEVTEHLNNVWASTQEAKQALHPGPSVVATLTEQVQQASEAFTASMKLGTKYEPVKETRKGGRRGSV